MTNAPERPKAPCAPDAAKKPASPAAQRALEEAAARRAAADSASGLTASGQTEIGGRRDGPDPARYGDWEKNGVAVDF